MDLQAFLFSLVLLVYSTYSTVLYPQRMKLPDGPVKHDCRHGTPVGLCRRSTKKINRKMTPK